MQVDLSFQDWIENINTNLCKTEWITVYQSIGDFNGAEYGGFFSALIPEGKAAAILKTDTWELSIGSGRPGIVTYYDKGNKKSTYQRVDEDGIEALVHYRSFPNKERYFEISEEFRLFYDLFEDQSNPELILYKLFNDEGEYEEVAKIIKNSVQVKLKFIKLYLAVRKMVLAIYFDCMRFSNSPYEELGIQPQETRFPSTDYNYSLLIRDCPGGNYKIQSWIRGKKLVYPVDQLLLEKYIEGRNERYEEFIIKLDDNGNEIYHTCENSKLADEFGRNSGCPFILTPVFFKREVLRKYYNDTKKYEVQDGHLDCHGAWSLHIDNNHPKAVMVFLYDLGKLTHKEQLHWKHYNIYYDKGMSHTQYQRAIMGEFADPEAPDLFFKMRFNDFQKKWYEKFGWYFFKPLNKGDEHHLKGLHIPLSEDQMEFDEQILSLTKILIDSLNEMKIAEGVKIAKEKPKGIDKLEAFLLSYEIKAERPIEFFRNLQSLRSTSAAHRKSSKNKDYKKCQEYFGIEQENFIDVFANILEKCIWTINTLDKHFLQK